MLARTMHILLVEDDEIQAEAILRASHRHQLPTNFTIVTDGLAALELLQAKPNGATRLRPNLILLDLNMPRMGGREVLAYLKTDDHFKTIPVVILTTSASEADVEECYRLAANCYLKKPVELDDFERLVKSINDFWLAMAKLPQNDPLGAKLEQVSQKFSLMAHPR